jgi:hypothetical protein
MTGFSSLDHSTHPFMKSYKAKSDEVKKKPLNIPKLMATLVSAAITMFFWIKIMFL